MAAAGLPQVRYAAVTDERWRSDRAAVEAAVGALGLPVFVKPASLGSSVGIVKVADRGAARAGARAGLRRTRGG